MKSILTILKKTLSDLLDYYISLDRSKFWHLLGSIILVSLTAILIVFIPTILYQNIVGSRVTVSLFSNGYEGYIDIIVDQAFLIHSIMLLILAFLSPHFMSFRHDVPPISISNTLKNNSHEKWSLFLLFIIIISLFEFYPSPYNDSSLSMGLLEVFNSLRDPTFSLWLYHIVQLISYTLTLLFSFILIRRSKFDFAFIKNKFKTILTIIFTIFLLDLIGEGVSNRISTYLTDFFISFDLYFLQIFIPGTVQLALSCLLISMKIVTLNYGYEYKADTNNAQKERGDIIDDEIVEL